jgi:hypothetical protein
MDPLNTWFIPFPGLLFEVVRLESAISWLLDFMSNECGWVDGLLLFIV